MATTRIPRAAIIGAEGMAGTSTIVLGLLVALKGGGIEVSGGQIGPDLIAPALHRRITKRFSHTFDPWLMTRDRLLVALAQSASGSELLLLEGGGGLFDLIRARHEPIKQAQLVKLLSAPLIVVVDGSSYQKNISALLEAYKRAGSEPQIAGIIVNKLPGSVQEARVVRAVRGLAGPRYLGSLPLQPADQFAGRPSAVIHGVPTVTTRNQLIRLGELISRHLDLKELRALASEAPLLDLSDKVYDSAPRCCRIAVADDQAFHITVQDNLDLLRRAGAQLIFCSPLADCDLPEGVSGLYLPGGYLEQYIDLIDANPWFSRALAKFVEAGGIVYAEGEAAAYLCREVEFASGRRAKMTGIIPAAAMEVPGDGQPRYAVAAAAGPSLLAEAGSSLRAIERTHWRFTSLEPLPARLRLETLPVSVYTGDQPAAQRSDGFSPRPSVLAVGAHLHWASHPPTAARFAQAAAAANLRWSEG